MPYHTWGDDDFDWDMLQRAEAFIINEMDRLDCMIPIKEKYGTLRYEMTFLLDTEQKRQDFKNIIRRAVIKFPQVSYEILEDVRDTLEDLFPEDEFKLPPELDDTIEKGE